MVEAWVVIIRDKDDVELYRYDYSPQVPLPGIGYTVWVADDPYKVTDIHIGYDERHIVIFVEEN